MAQNDHENLLKVIAILNKYGWVGSDTVGARASHTIFLVIQHADHKTRKEYLPMMRDAVKNKHAEASALALVEDRVALGDGGKQIYGSQVVTDSNGKFVRSSIEDPDNVDIRRAKVGLPPLADYLKQWNLSIEGEIKPTPKEGTSLTK